MGRTNRLLALGLLASTWSGVVCAQDVDTDRVFQPTDRWHLTELADGCSLSRDFVKDAERVTLSIKRIHPGSPVQVAVIGGPLRANGQIRAGFESFDQVEYERVAAATIGERQGFVFSGDLFGSPSSSDEQADQAARVRTFAVTDGAGETVRLQTRAMDKAVAALDACIVKQLQDAGLDWEGHGSFRTHAEPRDIAEWAQKLQRNYPSEAERSGLSGPVPVRLIVSKEGRVSRCDVTNYLTARVLRQTACDLLVEHARFTPATDAAGEPVTDFYWTRVVYQIRRGISADAHGFSIPHDTD